METWRAEDDTYHKVNTDKVETDHYISSCPLVRTYSSRRFINGVFCFTNNEYITRKPLKFEKQNSDRIEAFCKSDYCRLQVSLRLEFPAATHLEVSSLKTVNYPLW